MTGRRQYSKRFRSQSAVCKSCNRRVHAGLLFGGLCRRCRRAAERT